MVDTSIHALGAVFAIVGGTGAGLLALIFWRAYPEAPFGTVVALLSVTMSAMTVYHVVLFVVGPETPLLGALRSAIFTVLAIFLWAAIATHYRIDRTATGGR